MLFWNSGIYFCLALKVTFFLVDETEYHLVALCEKDRKENLQKLLEIVDITKVSSPEVLKSVFEYLGKSLLECVALKLIWRLRDSGKKKCILIN